jgi:methyl-accepting chemotaxis protein
MSLIKTADLGMTGLRAHAADQPAQASAPARPGRAGAKRAAAAEPQRRRQRTFARQQKAAERVASATTEVASGIAEAAAACDELRKAMEQIAAGAEEASAAAEESQRAMTGIASSNRAASDSADTALRKTESLQGLLATVITNILASIASVARGAERQAASVAMMGELDKQAANIGDIVKAVARIADQTNLLALNAAIEAARAGQHGKGFAVVADEVRTLAEISEKSARDIQDLVAQIQQEVKVIASGINASATAAQSEAQAGRAVGDKLEAVRGEMADLLVGAQEILQSGRESDAAAQEALKGSEAIAAAAAEQSAAAEEAVKTVEQQTTALAQSEQAASELSELADDLKNSTDISKSAEEVASASEELSAAVEEITRAATQIMTAIEQISRGAQQQAAATQESSAAITQIERGAQRTSERAGAALARGEAMGHALRDNRATMEALIGGVQQSVEDNARSREQINALEQVSRRIDKIVDTITTVSIQTNMLAVNGAIEAARAGEFGKGFMVVSTDIRNLARDSSDNAERIKDLEETATMAATEVEKNRLVAANLASVSGEMTIVLDSSRAIAKSAEEIMEALREAKRGVEQIASAAAQATTAAGQASQAAREQSKGAEELAAAVEEIASLADELQNSEAG